MAVVSMKQLLEAGVHFGHQTRRWNPKMAKFIFTERNGIYIIDLSKTVKKVEEAYNFLREVASQGEVILFVGTKKQAQEGKTVLLSSHILSEVEAVTDDVVIINKGKVLIKGTLQEVMKNLSSLEEVFFSLTEGGK